MSSDTREETVLAQEHEALCHALEETPEDEGPRRRLEDLTHRMDTAASREYQTRAKTVVLTLQAPEDSPDGFCGWPSGHFPRPLFP